MQLKNMNGKDLKISYPCVVLNVMVAAHNTNPQYATLLDPATKKYATSSEMSIEFEVDGPYRVRNRPAPFALRPPPCRQLYITPCTPGAANSAAGRRLMLLRQAVGRAASRSWYKTMCSYDTNEFIVGNGKDGGKSWGSK